MKIKVLGISGWNNLHEYFPNTNVLPLHDAAAVLIIDGKIIAMAEEERFSRRKHGYNCFPVHATHYCLSKANLNPRDLDKIAVYWDMPLSAHLKGEKWEVSQDELSKALFPPEIFGSLGNIKIDFIDHHLAHAISAYSCSTFDQSVVLVLDGQGELASTTIWKADNGSLEKLREMNSRESLGYFYESLTDFIGLESDEPGKTMGLASYGNPNFKWTDFFEVSDGIIRLRNLANIDMQKDFDEQSQIKKYWFEQFSKITCGPNQKSKFINKNGEKIREVKFDRDYVNLAAAGQKALEEIVIRLVEWAIKETGLHDICIAGGVGLNCVMNGKLLQNQQVHNLFVQPIAHDAGAALGAAIYSARLEKIEFTNVYFGPSFSDKEIRKELDRCGIYSKYYNNIEKKVAELLAKGYLVGWFQGGMEAGPRALGNRSILANPMLKNVKDIVNNRVKFRENWRPFAPSILEDSTKEFLMGAKDSPYMTISFEALNKMKEKFQGVVHVDGTTRPQTVSKKVNLRYWNLLNEFYNLTGSPAILNTSFNIKGEPIVCTPRDAIKTFFSSGLDYLVLGDYLVRKR